MMHLAIYGVWGMESRARYQRSVQYDLENDRRALTRRDSAANPTLSTADMVPVSLLLVAGHMWLLEADSVLSPF